MKICFIVGAFPKMKCGVGDYCSKLAQELARNGNEISIITSVKANSHMEGIKIYNIVERWDNSSTKNIIATLKKIKPDIVNIQYPSDEYKDAYYIFNILPIMIKLKIKCKLTETIHEYDAEPLSKQRKFRYYFNFKLMYKVIVVEEKFKLSIEKDFPNTNVEYIPISSNISRVTLTKDEKQRLKKELGLCASNVISYFGFINKQKGIENLLKSVSKMESTQLLVIGELNNDNEYHKEILNLISELKINNKVITTGFLDEEKTVAKYLNLTDLCVLPFINGVQKRNGSFLAAYNQLIPIVTTTANNEEDKEGVYYIKCNEQEVLLKKINYVLSKKEKISRQELNWETNAKQYINALSN